MTVLTETMLDLMKYRSTLRELLFQNGVDAGYGVTDDWILKEVENLVNKNSFKDVAVAK